MSRTDVTDYDLTQVPLFAKLSRNELRWALQLTTPVDVPAGQVLARQGSVGAEFFVVLDDSKDPGVPATEPDLNAWATKYKLDYPSAIDPNQTLSSIVGIDAYPGNVIVRTRDMKIVAWVAGVPPASFWSTLEKVIGGEPVLPGDE